MIGEAELRALPSRAFVPNPARGPIIEETTLLKALRKGWIAGAALDTHYPMPPVAYLRRVAACTASEIFLFIPASKVRAFCA